MNSMSIRKFGWMVMLAAVAVVCGPATAHAHVGVGPVHDLLHGLEHPLTGLDHIGAMVAVGIWAAQRGGRAIWLVPLSFVSVMTLGGALGMAGVKVPFVEPGIVLSLIVLGVFIAAAVRLPLAASVAIVSLFALAHGYAHGAEIPAAASGLSYAAGFIIATACLHAVGIGFGLLTQRMHASQLVRFAGAAIAVCGLYLVVCQG
jgi:urease accessory protein